MTLADVITVPPEDAHPLNAQLRDI